MTADQDASLQDVKQILETKPVLTTEEETVAAKIREHQKALLRPEVRLELEVEYIKKQKAFEDTILVTSREAVQTAIQNWKDDQAPLSEADIRTLLTNEFIQFDVKLKLRNGTTTDFQLIELPQEVEIKFVTTLRKRFVPLMKSLTGSEFKLDMNTSEMEKLQAILEAVPDVLDVLIDLVAIALNPFDEESRDGKKVDSRWVKQNIATHRILAIILGQLEVGRYRDFFLNGFRLSKSLKQSR